MISKYPNPSTYNSLGLHKKEFYKLPLIEAPLLDYPRLEEIHQNEFGVTNSCDEKPILVTYGLLNCVGIAGYSAETGVGFVAHYQDNTDVSIAIGTLLYHLEQANKGTDATFTVRMKGGIRGMSEHLVTELRSLLTQPLRPDIRFELIYDEGSVLQSGINGVDLGVDTRTGEFIEEYSPLGNPSHREPLPPEYKELVFASKLPSMHYYPAITSTQF